jgi:hypothetical protein
MADIYRSFRFGTTMSLVSLTMHVDLQLLKDLQALDRIKN